MFPNSMGQNNHCVYTDFQFITLFSVKVNPFSLSFASEVLSVPLSHVFFTQCYYTCTSIICTTWLSHHHWDRNSRLSSFVRNKRQVKQTHYLWMYLKPGLKERFYVCGLAFADVESKSLLLWKVLLQLATQTATQSLGWLKGGAWCHSFDKGSYLTVYEEDVEC